MAHVSAGAVLALYTDGLVERRGSDLDLRIATLGAAILEEAKDGAAGIAERVVDRMVETQTKTTSRFSSCIFTKRLVCFTWSYLLTVAFFAMFVGALKCGSGTTELKKGARAAALLALHEACANVIEHAYGDSSGTLLNRGSSSVGTRHSIRVTDHGTWREPVDGTDRGRGVMLMRGLMDSATIVQHAEGTDVLMEARQLRV